MNRMSDPVMCRVHLIEDKYPSFVSCLRQTCNVWFDGDTALNRSAFIWVPRHARCQKCSEIADALGYVGPTRDEILSVSIFCGALAGALEGIVQPSGVTLADLVAEHVAGDPPLATLDLAEQRGLDRPEGWAVVTERRPWLEVDRHGDPDGNNPHVWLPVALAAARGNSDRRCPCGAYGHLTPWGEVWPDGADSWNVWLDDEEIEEWDSARDEELEHIADRADAASL